ncbi:condensation domain-containing protein, partial [Streptomyces sp. DT171]
MDVDALRQAVTDVVTRHETLRTVLVEEDGAPWQHVHSPEEAARLVPLRVVSPPSGLNPDQVADWAEETILSASTEPFDLSCEVPLRVCLLGLGGGVFV